DEAAEADPVADTRLTGGLPYVLGEPGVLARDDQLVLELRTGAHQALESADQTDMVFARLDIADRKDIRSAYAEPLANDRRGGSLRDRAKLGRGRQRRDHHFVLVEIAVHLQDRRPRVLGAG